MTRKSIGVISDTHGLIRDEALQALIDSWYIIHAGDIGKPHVIEKLKEIAPVAAVRGNIDREAWATAFPATKAVRIENKFIYILHHLGKLQIDPKAAGFQVVISGHSHKPNKEIKDGVMYLNPGSAGLQRFKLPISVALVYIDDKIMEAEFIYL